MGVPALRGAFYAGLALVSIIFVIAALGSYTAMAKTDNPYSRYKTSLWYECSRIGSSDNVATCVSTTDGELSNCGGRISAFRAAQAFYIMTILLLFAALILGIVDHFNPKQIDRLPGFPKLWFLLLAVWIFFWSIIAWAIALSTAHRTCAGRKVSDFSNFSYGASPFLMLVVTCFAIFHGIIALLIPPRPLNETVREAARPTHAPHTTTDEFTMRNAQQPSNYAAQPYASKVDMPPYGPSQTSGNAPMG